MAEHIQNKIFQHFYRIHLEILEHLLSIATTLFSATGFLKSQFYIFVNLTMSRKVIVDNLQIAYRQENLAQSHGNLPIH